MERTELNSRPVVLHTRVVTGTGGGPEKTILNSPRFLADHGIESSCLFMHPPGDPGFDVLRAKAEAAGAEILAVADRGPLDFQVVRQAIRICRQKRVRIWHAHDYKSNALGLLVRRFHRMHLVTTAHGWVKFTARTPLYYRIDRFCLKRYERVICVSQDLIETCRNSGIREQRLRLIDNAIVESDYETTPPRLTERARFGFGNDQILLGACGRLSEEKGFHHLIDAVNRLVSDGQPVGLLIAGEGHLKHELQQQIDLLGLHNHVRLVGYLKDPRTLYRAIDMFVLSSLREGLPNVVLEAMATQRAVVTTKVNGIPRLIEDGQSGIVVESDSREALYDGILRCLADEGLRDRLASAGRRTIEQQFSFAKRMDKVVDVYRSLDPALARAVAQHSGDVGEHAGLQDSHS